MLEQLDQARLEKAHQLIRPYIHNTPVLSSENINNIAGCEIYFKCENFQKIGAFKMRGATLALLKLKEINPDFKVVTHSSGNHAQAIAKAAALLDGKAFIVMPSNAPKVKVDAVKAYGGMVTFCEPNLKARESEMEKIRVTEGATFIPPYDHEDIILGQATAAKELIEEIGKLDSILAPVGGGGLLAGTALATKLHLPETKIIGAEPLGADDASQSLKQGKLIPQTNPRTIGDGLLTSLGELNFKIIKKHVSKIITVNDQEIIHAMRLIWERMKIIIEPSCAVPLAAVLKQKSEFQNQKVGIILSGGNVDLDSYFDALEAKAFD